MTLAVISTWRTLVVLRRECDLEHQSDYHGSRLHRNREGDGTCTREKRLPFLCVCNTSTPAHHWKPIDGFFQVIVPPAMVGTWRTEAEEYLELTAARLYGNLVVIVAHGDLGKGTPSVYGHKNDLLGVPAALPKESRPGCQWKKDELGHQMLKNGKPILGAKLSGQYAKAIPRRDSSRYIVITTYQSWSDQVHDALKHQIDFYTTPEAAKGEHQQLHLVNPGVVIIDEAHLCQKQGAGHYQTLSKIQDCLLRKVKAIFLTGTPLTKGPEDLRAMLWTLQEDK